MLDIAVVFRPNKCDIYYLFSVYVCNDISFYFLLRIQNTYPSQKKYFFGQNAFCINNICFLSV